MRGEMKEGVLGENHLESGSLWWVSTGAEETQVAGLSVVREREPEQGGMETLLPQPTQEESSHNGTGSQRYGWINM